MPLFVVAHFAHHVINSLTVPLSAMIRTSFQLDYVQTGFVISAATLSYGLSQLPAGWLTDHIGPRLMITIGISGVAVGGLLVGLAPNYMILLIFMIIMGMMGGGYHPSAAPIITASVAPDKRGQALGLHLIGGTGSYFLAPLIAAGIATIWGWRGAYITIAIPAIIFGLFLYTRTKKLNPNLITPVAATTATGGKHPPVNMLRLMSVLAMSALCQGCVSSIVAFIPVYLVDSFGVADERAAATVSLVYLGSFCAAPLGGYLSDKLGRLQSVILTCFILPPFIFLINQAPYGFALNAAFFVLGIVSALRMPASEAYIVENSPQHRRSTILGLYYTGSMEMSGLFAPLMGFLIQRYGFFQSFSINAGFALLVTIVATIIIILGNRQPKPYPGE